MIHYLEKPLNFAVFASGKGSNFRAIVSALEKHQIKSGTLACLIVDKPCLAFEFAKSKGIPAYLFERKNYKSLEAFELAILECLKNHYVDFIFLAGYMRIIKKTLLEAFPEKIINLHPSLLPDFKGANAIKDAYQAGLRSSGISFHYVDTGLDSGPLIFQSKVVCEPTVDLESFEEAIHKAEHFYYPKLIEGLCSLERCKRNTIKEC